MAVSMRNCYESVDSSGELICGFHNTPLVTQSRRSQIQGQAGFDYITVLVCPIGKEQFRVVT